MYKKLRFLLFLNIFSWSCAQTIDMDFPHFAGKTYDFIIFQGDSQQKVIQGTIPEGGKFTMKIPKEYFPYYGMSRWLLTNSKEGGGLDMAISGKDFSVSCKEKTPDDTNIVYTGNSEVGELNNLNLQQQAILTKYMAMAQVIKAYSEEDASYPIFEKEYKQQQVLFNDFQQKLKINPDYAKKFLPIVNITRGFGTVLTETEKERAVTIAQYVADELDWQTLYTSGHWTTVISSWIEIHTEVLQEKNVFEKDFIKILRKIQDYKLRRDFAGRVAYFLTQKGRDDLIASIAPYVKSSGITDFEGSLGAYVKGVVGTVAPNLVFVEHIGSVEDHKHRSTAIKSSVLAGREYEKTLLLFYESGCGPCEDLLKSMPGKYKELASKGIQIISISADKDERVFKSRAKDFLWKYAYCDYDGISGINFENYGIKGTPTLFLIDKDGKILMKTASLQEVLESLR